MSSAESTSIRVITPGWCTTVQDLGRHGYQRYGVSVSGAMDRLAFVIANRLVKNPDTAAALEITIVGPELLFEEAAIISITGADLSSAIDGCAVPLWTTIAVHAGSHLTFGPRRTGARSYLAVAGGFDVPLWWGSRSTHLSSGTGGLDGRALMAEDVLHIGAGHWKPSPVGATLAHGNRPLYLEQPTLRMLAGPQQLNVDALSMLVATPYHVTSQSNRMGYRLEGQRLHDVSPSRRISDGNAMGALQIPPDGSPILLMADRPTTGGYPKVAAVISADLPQAAQLQPGNRVSFRTISLPEAEAALTHQWHQLNNALPAIREHSPL